MRWEILGPWNNHQGKLQVWSGAVFSARRVRLFKPFEAQMIQSWALDAGHGAAGFSVCLLGFGLTMVQSFLTKIQPHRPCWNICLLCAIVYWKYVTSFLYFVCRLHMWVYYVCIICTLLYLPSNFSHVALITSSLIHYLSYNCKYIFVCIHIYHIHMHIFIQPTVPN